MDQQQLEQLRGICAEAGFARKGNAFFRIVGDGVLQIFAYTTDEIVP